MAVYRQIPSSSKTKIHPDIAPDKNTNTTVEPYSLTDNISQVSKETRVSESDCSLIVAFDASGTNQFSAKKPGIRQPCAGPGARS